MSSGDLEFLGRVDGQLKVRGFRIEPGEIETAIRALPGVRDAVVRPHEDAPGETRLVAYVVADPARPVHIKDLGRLLRQSLPQYMVPSTFVPLEALPLTTNSKIDFAALPPPGPARAESVETAGEPRTALERELAGIWAAVMRIDRVGIEDDFFDLGGHSLLAMRLISRIRDAFGVVMPLQELFAAPTVAGLAATIEARLLAGRQPSDSQPAAEPAGRIARRTAAGPAPLSSSQERLWVLDSLIPGSPLYNIAYAARLRGELDVRALGLAFDAIENRHEVLRSVFPSVGGSAVQTLGPPGARPLSVVDLSGLPEDLREKAVTRRAAQEADRPFDLERGPLFRTTLLKLSPEEHVLLVTFHHIVFDGWSVPIFAEELAGLYDASREGRAANLAPLPIQFADFSGFQTESLPGADHQKELSWWRDRLRGAPPVIELPTDRPRPSLQSFAGAEETMAVPRKVADAIRALAQREGATPFMAFLAAFQLFLLRHGARKTCSSVRRFRGAAGSRSRG